jgi:hypothetical protein
LESDFLEVGSICEVHFDPIEFYAAWIIELRAARTMRAGQYVQFMARLTFQRVLTLHRNGSASINRIYSRNFDPHEIFNELKLQNNFASQPTQIRVC